MAKVPQQGSTGGTPNLSDKKFLYRKYLSKNEIFDLVKKCDGQIFGERNKRATNDYYKVVPYYQNVLRNVRKGIKNDSLTNKCIEYALFLKTNISYLLDLPPLIIVNGGFCDGSHRLSAIHLLSEYYDADNFRWNALKLKVDFYEET
tara:strand:- start:116 stop:556 length:441 start_codon:yes stop_codon:yes gene_type:complete